MAPIRKLLSLSVATALVAFGFTYAANINISNSGSSEFGQGILQTVACSGSNALSIKPSVTFVNSSSPNFYLSKITVSNIPSGCYGKDFTLKVFDTSTSVVQNYLGPNSSIANVYNSAGTFSLNKGSGYTINTLSNSSFEINITNPVLLANQSSRFTIESGDHVVYTCSTGGVCSIGDRGPGGGIVVITPNTVGGDGLYYEAADAHIGSGWCDNTTTLIGTGTAIGTGRNNTLLMKSVCTSGAAYVASAYTNNGYSDWFLPSKAERQEIYNNLNRFSNNPPGPSPHHSSSEASATNVWGQTFSDGVNYSVSKNTGNWYTTPIRSFS